MMSSSASRRIVSASTILSGRGEGTVPPTISWEQRQAYALTLKRGGLGFRVVRTDRLGGIGKRRIFLIDHHLRKHRYDRSGDALRREFVVKGLLNYVADLAFRFCDSHCQRYGVRLTERRL
jgi:hypothetical protein